MDSGRMLQVEVCAWWGYSWHDSLGWLHLPPNCMKTSFPELTFLDMLRLVRD